MNGRHGKLTARSLGWAMFGASTCLATPALAQQAGSGDSADASEIIVTAQRRSERLIDVPATVAVVAGEELAAASISSSIDLGQLVPGLQVSNTGAYTSFAIRGVSSEATGPGAENNVAVYVDGVYVPSKSAGVFDFPDIQSIEVLKGPQGALYGRNATGGAILFKTLEPSFDTHAKLGLTYGRFNEREAKAVVSGALVPDVLAASIAGYYRKTDGYLKDITTGDRLGGVQSGLVRGKLLVTPSDTVKIQLAGYYHKRIDNDAMAFTIIDGNSAGVLADPNAIVDTPFGFSASNNPNQYRTRTIGLSLTSAIELGVGTLNLVTGYTDLKRHIFADGDYSSVSAIDFTTSDPQETFSQDIYLATRKLGSLDFVVGASYFHDVSLQDPVRIIFGGVPGLDIYSKQKTDALAAYIDGNLELTEQLKLSAGVRWTTEQKRHYGGFNDPTFPFVGKKRWSNISPRLALRYMISDDANVYASYSRGFKSGLFNSSQFFVEESVRPEIVDSIEVGFKGRIADGLTIGLAGYYYDYKDIQVTTFQANQTILQNAAKARIYGADFELTYQPDENLTFRAAVSPVHTKYTSFPGGVVLAPTPSASCPAGFTFCGNGNAALDLSGNRLPRAPNLTANASVSYTLHAGRQAFDLYANVYYSGKFYWEIGNRLAQEKYATVNGRITWRVDEGPLSIQVWGRNLTNTKYYSSQGIGFNADGLLSAPPRTVGVTLGYDY